MEASLKFRHSPKEYADAKYGCIMRIMNKANSYYFTIRGEGVTDYSDYIAYGDEEYISEISGISMDKKIMIKLLNIIDQEIN